MKNLRLLIPGICVGALVAGLALAEKTDPVDPSAKATVVAEEPATSWPVFRGNSALNGIAKDVLPAPLKLAWKYAVTGPVVATAAISDGTVFVGSQDGDFHAIDLATGKQQWTKQLGDTLESSACVVGGKVFVGSGDGHLYALDIKSGNEAWKYETDGEILGGVNFHVHEGKAFIYVGSYDNFLHCVDAETGRRQWVVETGNYVNGTPAVADGKVMFGGCDAVLYMVDAVTGEDKGSIEIGSYIANSVSVRDGVVYLAHYGNQAEAYNIAEKKQLWVHKDREFPYFASPTVLEDMVLVADRGKKLFGLNRADGQVKWTFKARRSIDSSPVVSGPLTYFGSDDGRLYAVDLKTGEEKWAYEIGDAITASPAVAGGRLVISALDSVVYCFSPN